MKNIILLGYMGAGKTSVGKALAKKLEMEFYDLDWYIEERYRRKVADIFAQKGEEGFRDIEHRMLHEVAEFENVVLALGGGTPCFYDNIDYANRSGITVFLDASPETIVRHLKISHTVRPLLKDKTGDELLSYIQKQIALRMPYYNKAQYRVDVNCLDSFAKIDLLTDTLLHTIGVPIPPKPSIPEY